MNWLDLFEQISTGLTYMQQGCHLYRA